MLTRRQNARGSRRAGAKRCRATLLGIALLAAYGVAGEARAREVRLGVEELRLENGLTLLLVERPEAPYVAAGWVVRAGSADDPAGRRGLAHVLEHMMFQGSRRVGTRDWAAENAAEREADGLRRELEALAGGGRRRARRAEELERRIAELDERRRRLVRPGELTLRYSEAGATGLNGFTFEDFTLFFVRLPPGRLELWFWLESDRLLDPVFRDFAREREVIRQEVAQRVASTPTGRADQALRRAFWGGSSYGWRALGTVDDLGRIEPGDAERFFARHYAPDRLTAVLVGSFDRRRARSLARTYFGRLPAGDAATGPAARDAEPAAPPGGQPFEARCVCPRQARVLYPTVAYRHPDSYRLQVLAGVLNGRTGRLYRSLVLDREIAFAASATQLSYRDAGSFVFSAETRGEATPEELVAAWDGELARLQLEPVDEGELRKVKNQLIASSLRASRRPGDLARQLLVYSGLGEWRQIEDWPRRVLEVDAEKVRQAARRLTPEKRLIAYYRRPEDPAEAAAPAPKESLPGAPDKQGRDASGVAVSERPLPESPPRGGGRYGGGSGAASRSEGAPPATASVAAASGVPAPAPHLDQLVFETVRYRPPSAERVELAGGVPLYLAPDPSLPLVELTVALRAGAFLEAPDEVGLAGIGAALLRRGGAGERTADELDERVALLGAELDTTAGERRSGLRLSVSSWELEPALDLAFEVLARPRLEADRLEVLRRNAHESMARRNQDPLAILEREWAWLLWGDFWGSRRLTPATLKRVTRETIEGFHRAYWRPERFVLALSGDFDTASAVAGLERRLAAWPAVAGSAPRAPWPPPAPGPGHPPGLYLSHAPTPQAKVLLGHRIEADLAWTSRERAAIAVLEEVLGGGGAVSRLGGRLRTAGGLVYRTSARIEPGPAPPGSLRVFFETDPGKALRAIELAVAEIERLRADLVHPRELEVVRRTLLDRFRGRFDTPEKIAGYHAENELLGRPRDYWERHLELLGAVTREEVRAAAREYLRPERLLFLVVGPEPSGDDAERLARATGHPPTRLPKRDPLTLEPLTLP